MVFILFIVVIVIITLGIIYAPRLTFKILKGGYGGTKFIGKKAFGSIKSFVRFASTGIKKLNKHRRSLSSIVNLPEHKVNSINDEDSTLNPKINVQGSDIIESDAWSDL